MTVKLYEGDKTETGGAGIEITDNKVVNLKLREENNLIEINEDDEAYVDLQLADGIAPDDDFPVGVTTGRVLVADGRPVAGTVTISKTTSGDYTIYLYGDDGKVYVDNGTGVWKILARPEFVTQDEYDALPNSKNTDNLLRIIVDTHIDYELLPWSEVEALTPVPDGTIEELNKYPTEYKNYYLETGDASVITDGQGNFLYWHLHGEDYFFAMFDTENQTEQEIRDICSSFHYPPTAEQINDAVEGLRIPIEHWE